jgi:anti-sigma factor RsiW
MDEMVFQKIGMSERAKENVRRQAAAEQGGKRFALPKSWMLGSAALVAAVTIVAGYPLLQQPAAPSPGEQAAAPPSNGGTVGSDLSRLITTPASSPEEAKAAFGDDLRLPTAVPEGYTLSEIVVTGEQGQPARDVVFTYSSGERSATFVASRSPASFPADLFSKTEVNGVEGFVFAQPGMTELFWTEEGIQYSVTGPLDAGAAMRFAQSLED